MNGPPSPRLSPGASDESRWRSEEEEVFVEPPPMTASILRAAFAGTLLALPVEEGRATATGMISLRVSMALFILFA
jgi:hypothetical protein